MERVAGGEFGEAEFDVVHGFRDHVVAGEVVDGFLEAAGDEGGIAAERGEGLFHLAGDGFEQLEGGGGLALEVADATGGGTAGRRGEGRGDAGGLVEALDRLVGGDDGFAGERTQLLRDDVERAAARTELGAA